MPYIGLAPFNVATANVVTTNLILDQTIISADLADSAITAAKLDTGAVTEAKIGTGAVTTTKLGANAVTTAKLDTNISVAGTLTSGGLLTGANITTSGNVIADNYIGVVATPSISSGTLSLDCGSATIFEVSLGSNITTLNITNVPQGAFGFVLQLNITGSYTVTWPSAIKWSQNTAPTLSTTNGRTDTFTFITTDGGTTLYGIVASQNALTT